MKITALGIGTVLAGMIYLGLNGIATQLKETPPPVLEFHGPPIVTDVANGKATFTFLVRRNALCPTTVHVRWYDLERQAFDVGSAKDLPSTPAPITLDFQPFAVTLDLPEGVSHPAYAPIFSFSGGCAGREPVTAPMGDVRG